MSIAQIFKSSFYYGVIPKISTLINVLLLPIITPYLTPYDYGIWGIISSYSGMFLAIAPLGLHMHLSNSYFEYKKWQLVWGHILFLFFLSGVIFSLIYILIIIGELGVLPTMTRVLVAICSSIPILLFGNVTLATHLYPLENKPFPLVIKNLVASLSAILVSFIMIYFFKLGYWGFVLGTAIAAIVNFSLFVYPLYFNEDIVPTIDRNVKRIKNWLKVAFPVIPHALGFMLLSSSSRIIMSWYNIPLVDIGLFSNGYMIGDYVTIVSTALVTALVPQMQRAFRECRYIDYRRLYYLCQLTTFGVVFCVSVWMPQIYKILIRNSSFQESIPIASLICYANVLMPLYSFVSTTIFIEKQTKYLLWLVFLPGVINLTVCLAFIPLYGYKVAIYSTLISYWSQLLIPFISAYHKQKMQLWMGTRKRILELFICLVFFLFLSQKLMDVSIGGKLSLSFVVVIIYVSMLRFTHIGDRVV